MPDSDADHNPRAEQDFPVKRIATLAYAYVLPFVLYLLGTNFIGRFGDEHYPLAYSAVVLIVGSGTCGLLWYYRVMAFGRSNAPQHAIKIHSGIAYGVLTGTIGIALWIGICHLNLERFVLDYLPSFLRPGERMGFNPFEELASPASAWAFIAMRLVGIAVLVPVAEELFWRGFLLRWLIDPNWKEIPLGTYTLHSCLTVVLMFTLAHPEWLAAATYCLLINGLLYWKRDLWLCIVAHSVSNLLLAIYVLLTGVWWLW